MAKPRATAPRRVNARRTTRRRDETKRMVEMIDHATEAKRLADTLGEKFLAYLLAMVILEMSHVEGARNTSISSVKRKRAGAAPPDGS